MKHSLIGQLACLVWLCILSHLATALPTNAQSAPRGDETPHVEAIAPTLVTAGHPFTFLYRTNPPRFPAPESLLHIAPVGALDKEFTLPLTEPHKRVMGGQTQASLPTPGRYELSINCTSDNGASVRATATVRVLDGDEAKQLNDATPWILPNKALYFVATADAKWAALPETEREQIQLEKRSMSTNLNGQDGEWLRLQAWNELVMMLSPRFLPALQMLRVFETATARGRFNVTYATYQRGNANVVVMQEVGKRVWLYLEATPGANPPSAANVLLSDWKTDAASGHLLLARTMSRFRGLTSDGPFEPVKMLFMRVDQDSQINLNFPGYP